ncbi:hypothetical protein [Flavobacterium subsaxonicum]|uniref:Uncharacterized protein n=1 Tax=Flavobacterium subsaxonicum WB 4.1-42 = DSM 21790 TaxID=1121898 RepID=A0A0A2MQF9_9FLAO|nr:hypothetical protein [Flavobacterium subsaxonicum]KGO93653.1 hypothetical protein Q766_06740 [Flavobacterium subsaxonicum WB 4.1-42 = DSM 21790]
MTGNIYLDDLYNSVSKIDQVFITFDTYIGLEKGENISDNPFFQAEIEKNNADEYILRFLESQKNIREHSLERNFCYQLYYRWYSIVNGTGHKYSSLNLNGEINKANLTLPLKNYENLKNLSLFEKIKENGLIDQTYFVPDFVLHGGQDNINHQTLIAEVKLNENLKSGNFEKDFYKLAIYQKLYQFKSCCFIILKMNIKELLTELKKVDTDTVDKKSFWFILKNVNNTLILCLDDLV